jgi:hypothetical protein
MFPHTELTGDSQHSKYRGDVELGILLGTESQFTLSPDSTNRPNSNPDKIPRTVLLIRVLLPRRVLSSPSARYTPRLITLHDTRGSLKALFPRYSLPPTPSVNYLHPVLPDITPYGLVQNVQVLRHNPRGFSCRSKIRSEVPRVHQTSVNASYLSGAKRIAVPSPFSVFFWQLNQPRWSSRRLMHQFHSNLVLLRSHSFTFYMDLTSSLLSSSNPVLHLHFFSSSRSETVSTTHFTTFYTY